MPKPCKPPANHFPTRPKSALTCRMTRHRHPSAHSRSFVPGLMRAPRGMANGGCHVRIPPGHAPPVHSSSAQPELVEGRARKVGWKLLGVRGYRLPTSFDRLRTNGWDIGRTDETHGNMIPARKVTPDALPTPAFEGPAARADGSACLAGGSRRPSDSALLRLPPQDDRVSRGHEWRPWG